MVSDDMHLMWLDTHTSTFIQDIIKVNSLHGQSPVSNGFSSNKATENYREHNDSGLPVAQAVSLVCCLNLELIKATNTQEDDNVEMHPHHLLATTTTILTRDPTQTVTKCRWCRWRVNLR
jgi:hypothetical protein